MTFIHQDLWYGKFVPSSHQRCKSSPVFAKSAGLPHQRCPVNLSKENNILTTNMPSVLQKLICPAKDYIYSQSDSCPASVEKSRNSSHTILCTFNRSNNQIWKGIPIPDCLRNEWALVNISSSSGGLKSHYNSLFLLHLIGGIRSSVGMLTFVQKNQSTVSPPFLERLPF